VIFETLDLGHADFWNPKLWTDNILTPITTGIRIKAE